MRNESEIIDDMKRVSVNEREDEKMWFKLKSLAIELLQLINKSEIEKWKNRRVVFFAPLIK